MGAVPGVGVVGEPRSASYQRGQIFNRPTKKRDQWCLFRIQHRIYSGSFPAPLNPAYQAGAGGSGLVIFNTQGSGAPYYSVAYYACSKVRIIPPSSIMDIDSSAGLSVEWRAEQIYDRVESGVRTVGSVIGFKISDLKIATALPIAMIEIGQETIYDYTLLDGYGLSTLGIAVDFCSMQIASSFLVSEDSSSNYLLNVDTRLYSGSTGDIFIRQANATPPPLRGSAQYEATSIAEAFAFTLDLTSPESSSYQPRTSSVLIPALFPPPPNSPRSWSDSNTRFISGSYVPPPP